MKADLINPFLSATMNVLETMAQVKPIAGKPAVKSGNLTWGMVSGLIGLASETLKGNLVVSFDEPSICTIVGNLLGEKFASVNADVVEAVGELTNMITGNAKRDLFEMGYKFDMALPMIITGKNVEIVQLGKLPVITIPFAISGVGDFVVEASLVAR